MKPGATGLLPLLVDGELRIAQTLAILDHLDRKLPDPPLYPRDDAGRARRGRAGAGGPAVGSRGG